MAVCVNREQFQPFEDSEDGTDCVGITIVGTRTQGEETSTVCVSREQFQRSLKALNGTDDGITIVVFSPVSQFLKPAVKQIYTENRRAEDCHAQTLITRCWDIE